MADPQALLAALDLITSAIARKVAEHLQRGQLGMVDQGGSPLGRRRHIAAVRRRAAAGEAGAAIVADRYLLSEQALADELQQATAEGAKRKRKRRKAEADAGSVSDELRRELGLLRSA